MSCGSVAAGVVATGQVSAEAREAYLSWLAAGNHAGMGYMANHLDIRFDSRLLLEGATQMICMAFSYLPRQRRSADKRGISDYALYEDYHLWVKRRIRESGVGELLGEEGIDWRICVDSAPVMERYWAEQAGLGRIGMNGNLIVDGVGCEVILAEIVCKGEWNLGLNLGYASTHNRNFEDSEWKDEGKGYGCEGCGGCLKACPSGALSVDAAGRGVIDSRRCLSYLTIECKEVVAKEALGRVLFGCDRCVRACPHNREGEQNGAYCTEPILDWVLKVESEQQISELPKRILKTSCLARRKWKKE